MSNVGHKRLVFFHTEIKTPPVSEAARGEIGFHLRDVQRGESLSMPISRPMPSIGKNVHELRVNDSIKTWRVIYQIRTESVCVIAIFAKKTQTTPQQVIDQCRRRIVANPG